ncbi:NUDIX hydrolase [Parvimonas micra]|uniref:NUDIX hydrolase n=1 Tax=Parvimonas micra TaxID=33033 RepID=UPI0022B6ECCC|nr:NUDIX hydrolase [Parvimonas micra]WBB29700.1 NUDIX hydrolase [Parvimonas micra]
MGMYKKIFEDYVKNNKNEEDLNIICNQLDNKSDRNLIDRKNFTGHFTSSCFVVSKKTNKIILVYHNFLKKYLQPGGHIESTDLNPLETSKRELLEETGIGIEKLTYYKADLLNELVPLNISVHQIPENIIKEEKKHYHYDLQYLFFCEEELDVNIDLGEVNNFKWVSWREFKEMSIYRNIAKKIEKTKKIPI